MSVKQRFERLGRSPYPRASLVQETSLAQAYGEMRSVLADEPTWGKVCRALPDFENEKDRGQLESYVLDHMRDSNIALSLDSKHDMALITNPSASASSCTQELILKALVDLNPTRCYVGLEYLLRDIDFTSQWPSLKQLTLIFYPQVPGPFNHRFLCPNLGTSISDLKLIDFGPMCISWPYLWDTILQMPDLQHLTLLTADTHIEGSGFWEGHCFGRGVVWGVAEVNLKSLTLNCGDFGYTLHQFSSFFSGVSFPNLEQLILHAGDLPDKMVRRIPPRRLKSFLPSLREVLLVGKQPRLTPEKSFDEE